MAVVSIKWSKAAPAHLKYVLKDRADEDVLHAHGCTPETAISDFESVRKEHNNEGGNHILHVVQSFSREDSKKLSPDEFNSIGQSLMAGNFPDHQYVLRTHTDTAKIHNHFIVNIVNSETGRKIENKTKLIKQLQDSSDALCVANELSVINREAHDRAARIPYKAQQMVRNGKKSYIYDLSQKADVARSIATSFDEYRDTLSGFGIRTVIEEKNISYFYPDKGKGKRGSKLGHNYDKPGLVEAFKANDAKFAQNPELKARLLGQYEQIRKFGMPKLPKEADKFAQLWDGKVGAWKDYEQFTKVDRRSSPELHRSERELLSAFVPAAEIKQARGKSIFEYCKNNKIVLGKNDRGDTVLVHKPFVVVSEFEFKNTKNGTRGSLIDLVAADKNMTLLQSVAHINGNDRLLLLEQHMGEVKHSYRSFYVPRPKRADWDTASAKFAQFLTSFGAEPSHARNLQQSGQVQVDKRGSVWLFPKEDTGAAIEFVESAAKMWTRKNHGRARKPFHAETGTSSKMLVFSDPQALLRTKGLDLFSGKPRKVGVLGLFELDERLVHQYVSENKHVSTIHFVPAQPGQASQVELDFFENLRRKYKPLGIGVEHIPHERALHNTVERGREDSGLSR